MPKDGCITRSQKTRDDNLGDTGREEGEGTDKETTLDRDIENDDYEDAEDDGSPRPAAPRRETEEAGESTPKENEGARTRNAVISDQNVSKFRILQKLTKGLTRAKYNKEKLEKLITAGKLPKGLGVRRFPLNVPSPSLKLQLRWDEAHTNLSRELTFLMIEYWEERKNKLLLDINEIEETLNAEATKEEVTHIQSLLKKYVEETEDELQRREERRKKIRETEQVAEREKEEEADFEP